MSVIYFLAVTISDRTVEFAGCSRSQAWNLNSWMLYSTAVSAVSVTGLTVVSLPEVYNEVGYFILMFVLQFGGIGIMTLGNFFLAYSGQENRFEGKAIDHD